MRYTCFPKFMADTNLSDLIRAYILGDILLDTPYKKAVISAVITTLHECSPNSEHVTRVYISTPPSSPFRRLLVDVYAYKGIKEVTGAWTAQVERCPKEFLVDVCKALM